MRARPRRTAGKSRRGALLVVLRRRKGRRARFSRSNVSDRVVFTAGVKDNPPGHQQSGRCVGPPESPVRARGSPVGARNANADRKEKFWRLGLPAQFTFKIKGYIDRVRRPVRARPRLESPMVEAWVPCCCRARVARRCDIFGPGVPCERTGDTRHTTSAAVRMRMRSGVRAAAGLLHVPDLQRVRRVIGHRHWFSDSEGTGPLPCPLRFRPATCQALVGRNTQETIVQANPFPHPSSPPARYFYHRVRVPLPLAAALLAVRMPSAGCRMHIAGGARAIASQPNCSRRGRRTRGVRSHGGAY